MNLPQCHHEDMVQDHNGFRSLWRCEYCWEPIPFYHHLWAWVWLEVTSWLKSRHSGVWSRALRAEYERGRFQAYADIEREKGASVMGANIAAARRYPHRPKITGGGVR